MSVPIEFHSTLCRTYQTLCISVRQPITVVKAEWNEAADVWEIATKSALSWSKKEDGRPDLWLAETFPLELHNTIWRKFVCLDLSVR